MFLRVVDAEGAVGASRSHGVVVVEALLPLGVIEQRLMRNGRAPADIADMDWAQLTGRGGGETRHVNGERQVGAGSARDACHVFDAVTLPDEDVVKRR